MYDELAGLPLVVAEMPTDVVSSTVDDCAVIVVVEEDVDNVGWLEMGMLLDESDVSNCGMEVDVSLRVKVDMALVARLVCISMVDEGSTLEISGDVVVDDTVVNDDADVRIVVLL